MKVFIKMQVQAHYLVKFQLIASEMHYKGKSNGVVVWKSPKPHL